MKLMNKSIVLSSIVGISFYGIQQLRSPSVIPQHKVTHTLIQDESNKNKEGKSILAKKQNQTLANPTLVVTPTDWESDLEQAGQETPELNTNGYSNVSFKNGLLTIEADNTLLAELIAQIASKANIPVNSESIDPEQRITLSIQDTSMDTVLHQLLTGYDYFFLYSANKARLQATWIYSAGTGQTIALVDHENRPETLSEDDLYSSDPTSRVLALQRYAGSDTRKSVQHIQDAVEDDDPDVRATAIILTAQDNAIELPITTLKELAESDPSPTVRSVALNTLSMNSELSLTQIAELAETALNDPDASIRKEAEAILEGLEKLENKEVETPLSQQAGNEVET